jgi:hypothetical protein
MAERILDAATDYLFPHIAPLLIGAMELCHESQNPPYSKGLWYITIRMKFCEMRISNRYFYRELGEPVFTDMVRGDMIYCD